MKNIDILRKMGAVKLGAFIADTPCPPGKGGFCNFEKPCKVCWGIWLNQEEKKKPEAEE